MRMAWIECYESRVKGAVFAGIYLPNSLGERAAMPMLAGVQESDLVFEMRRWYRTRAPGVVIRGGVAQAWITTYHLFSDAYASH